MQLRPPGPEPVRRMRFRGAAAILASGLATATPGVSAAPIPALHAIEQPPPPILAEIAELDGMTAVAVSLDGKLAATSWDIDPDAKKRKTEIRLHGVGDGESPSLVLKGEVRDLLFSPSGDPLFALVHNPAKVRPDEVHLVRIDVATLKTRRELLLPPSAQGLGYWPVGVSVLIACANEIRSVVLPDLRSGPLFRVLGVNTSVATLDGSRVLVGRDDGVIVVDLDDPSGEDQMPIRQRIPSPEPVGHVAVSRDGTRPFARLRDGTLLAVDLVGSALEPVGEAGLLVRRPWPQRPAEEGLPVEPAEGVDVDPTEPAAVVPVAAAESPEPAEQRIDPPVVDEPRSEASAPPNAQVAGSISGPGAGEVAAVVLFGPDNILREALRVPPNDDGRWSAEGLEAGRYRIQLLPAGEAVLLTDPSFRVVEVRPDRATLTADFRVLEPQ